MKALSYVEATKIVHDELQDLAKKSYELTITGQSDSSNLKLIEIRARMNVLIKTIYELIGEAERGERRFDDTEFHSHGDS